MESVIKHFVVFRSDRLAMVDLPKIDKFSLGIVQSTFLAESSLTLTLTWSQYSGEAVVACNKLRCKPKHAISPWVMALSPFLAYASKCVALLAAVRAAVSSKSAVRSPT